ncbi:hypothetical protein [Bacillus sp. P14.5]|nr:hypothetical protein [Bacillus sp. P14.5]
MTLYNVLKLTVHFVLNLTDLLPIKDTEGRLVRPPQNIYKSTS